MEHGLDSLAIAFHEVHWILVMINDPVPDLQANSVGVGPTFPRVERSNAAIRPSGCNAHGYGTGWRNAQ